MKKVTIKTKVDAALEYPEAMPADWSTEIAVTSDSGDYPRTQLVLVMATIAVDTVDVCPCTVGVNIPIVRVGQHLGTIKSNGGDGSADWIVRCNPYDEKADSDNCLQCRDY